MSDFDPVEIDFMYGGNTQTEGKKIENSLESIAQKSKDTQTQVNNIGKQAVGFNSLNMSVQQVVRELPAATMGLNMFFLAIGNNIPILTDNIKRARLENEALKKSGASTTPVWKQLIGSIFSWQSLMMVGITVATVYGEKIFNALSRGSEAAKRAKEDIKEFNETFATTIAEPIAKVNKLSIDWKKLGDDMASKKRFIDANKTAFKELGVEINNVKEAENFLVDNVAAFRSAMVSKAMSVAAMKTATEKYQEYYKNMREAEKMPDTVNVMTSGSQSITGAGTYITTVAKNTEKIKALELANAIKKEADKLILESTKQDDLYKELLKKAGIKELDEDKNKPKTKASVFNAENETTELIMNLRSKRAQLGIDLQKDTLRKRINQIRLDRDDEIRAIVKKEEDIVTAYNRSKKDEKGFIAVTSLSQINPKLAKELAAEKEKITKLYGEKEVEATEKYQQEVSDTIFKYADERTRLAYEYNKDIEQARELGLKKWADDLEREKQARIDNITLGMIEETELYKVASDDKLQLSHQTTQLLIEDLQTRIEAEIKAGKLSKEQGEKWLKDLQEAQIKAGQTNNQNNPFAQLGAAIKLNASTKMAFNNAPVGTSTEELAKLESASNSATSAMFGAAGASLSGVQGILQSVVGGLDQLGMLTEEQKKDADNIIGMVGGAANIAMGIASGNPIQIIQGSIDLLVNGIEYFDFKNKELEKSQRKHMDNVKELELKYARMQRAVDKALGTDIYKAQREQIANQKKQIEEYELWLADERAKKKRKQDETAIAETEAKIQELKDSIEDQISDITESLAQTTVKDLASEISDSLVEAFQSGQSAAEAMGDVVNNVLRNAVINALKLKVLEKLLSPAIDQFAVDLESGGELTGSEAERFRNTITAAGEAYFKALNEANDALGGIFSGDASANLSGIKGDVSKMTEQTGSALVGQITAMRLNVAALLSNSKSSVESISKVLAALEQIRDNTHRLNRIDETLYYIKQNGVKIT